MRKLRSVCERALVRRRMSGCGGGETEIGQRPGQNVCQAEEGQHRDICLAQKGHTDAQAAAPSPLERARKSDGTRWRRRRRRASVRANLVAWKPSESETKTREVRHHLSKISATMSAARAAATRANQSAARGLSNAPALGRRERRMREECTRSSRWAAKSKSPRNLFSVQE